MRQVCSIFAPSSRITLKLIYGRILEDFHSSSSGVPLGQTRRCRSEITGRLNGGFYVFFQHAPFFGSLRAKVIKYRSWGSWRLPLLLGPITQEGPSAANKSPRVVKANRNHKHFNAGKGPSNELAWPSRTNGSLFFEGIPTLPRISIRATARNESSLSSRFQVFFFSLG